METNNNITKENTNKKGFRYNRKKSTSKNLKTNELNNEANVVVSEASNDLTINDSSVLASNLNSRFVSNNKIVWEDENAKANSKTKTKVTRNKPVRHSMQNLKISFLGGVGEVGKNMTTLEYGNDMIVMDCGLTFPGDDMPGVDLVVPDITYLIQNKSKIKGIIITHGHEDHIGSIPYVLTDIEAPIFGTRLTNALIENKLKEHKNLKKVKLNTIKSNQKIKLGCFEIEFLKVTHSISGSVAFAIKTPVGMYVHTGDFKIDLTPLDKDKMDLGHFAELGNNGVLLLTSDSTNAERPGYSMPEIKVGETLDNIFNGNKQKRIFVATFASNIHRVQQILNISKKYGRKVAFSGRSMVNVCETASKLGELQLDKGQIIDISTIDKYADSEICIISTGTQGEPASALTRMAAGEFNKVEIGENDLIILSSSVIPGNEVTINRVINLLYRKGASVIYEQIADVHVSGHAYSEELKLMLSLVRPKFFVPVHGEYRQLKAHANIAESVGIPKQNIIIPDLGNQILINKQAIKLSDNVPSGIRLVDGLGVGDVGSTVLKDRIQLSEEGLCVVTITINNMTGALTSKPELITRGFVYLNDNDPMLEEGKDVVINAISSFNFKSQDWSQVKINIKKLLGNYFYKKLKRRPLILPVIIEV